MSVIVRRKGVKFVASLPEGHDWTVTVFRGRILAFCPDHPPIILGMNPTPEWVVLQELSG